MNTIGVLGFFSCSVQIDITACIQLHINDFSCYGNAFILCYDGSEVNLCFAALIS